MGLKSVLTEPLRSSKAVDVLEKSLQSGRLAHAMLLFGENEKLLEEAAHGLAAVLLNITIATEDEERFSAVEKHPDFFPLRPSKKARAIRAEDTRELIRHIQQSPLQSERKVAVVYEADRLVAASQSSSANIFLKTLEEPPLDTTIILLTPRPYELLDTIRSRCFNFRIPSSFETTDDESWEQWLQDYSKFLLGLLEMGRDKENVARSFMTAYGLVARFIGILSNLVASAWETEKNKLPQDMDDEERDAMREGSSKAIRHRLLKEMENQTRTTVAPFLTGENPGEMTSKFTDSIRQLESVVGLLKVNLKEDTALEDYFLSCMRIWSR